MIFGAQYSVRGACQGKTEISASADVRSLWTIFSSRLPGGNPSKIRINLRRPFCLGEKRCLAADCGREQTMWIVYFWAREGRVRSQFPPGSPGYSRSRRMIGQLCCSPHTMDLLWEKFQLILPLFMKPISFQLFVQSPQPYLLIFAWRN